MFFYIYFNIQHNIICIKLYYDIYIIIFKSLKQIIYLHCYFHQIQISTLGLLYNMIKSLKRKITISQNMC